VIEIRPLAATDVSAVHGLLADPEVAAWFRPAEIAEPFTPLECESMVTRQLGHWAAHGFGMSLGWEDGACVGWSLLQHCLVAGASEVEIGWTVARQRWGEGLGTRLGQHALEGAVALGVERTVAYTRIDNAASRRVMEKLGLAYEREFEHRGMPHVLYATYLAGANPRSGSRPLE
jgi:RimJ/RimL family protein N-acetyltransferase